MQDIIKRGNRGLSGGWWARLNLSRAHLLRGAGFMLSIASCSFRLSAATSERKASCKTYIKCRVSSQVDGSARNPERAHLFPYAVGQEHLELRDVHNVHVQ